LHQIFLFTIRYSPFFGGIMDKFKSLLLAVLRFLGLVLLVDLGLFILVSLSCLIGTRCTGVQWSERMFWAGMLVMVTAMPAVLAMLSTSQGYFDNPYTAGMDMQVAGTIIKDGRRGMNKRTRYAFRAGFIGLGAIAISALIDLLTR
jgi:hypothetical protein